MKHVAMASRHHLAKRKLAGALASVCRGHHHHCLVRNGTLRRCPWPSPGRVSGPDCVQQKRALFFFFKAPPEPKKRLDRVSVAVVVIATGTLLIYSLYPANEFRQVKARAALGTGGSPQDGDGSPATTGESKTAWFNFAKSFESLSNITDIEWSKVSDKVVDLIVPEWSKLLPGYVRKLQRELSMAPGSLADEIWREAHDPYIHPEIQYSAKVRVSGDLCDEEKEFLARRKRVTAVALASYLGLDPRDVHPEDVPVIALCGSGGGLRALVAGTGSLAAAAEDGLFDCATYTSGVSGSCWLQALYNSSIADQRFPRLVDHLKARLAVHFAYPPVAFASLTSAPTNKYLLSGMVEKLKGDPTADFGLVDVYGILLAARLLVPRGELGVNERDFKLSNQRDYIKYGQNPMPIYTAVRHEIPGLDPAAAAATNSADRQQVASSSSPSSPAASEMAKETAKREAWFQWFEITPYELFCEEFGAGIPTWAMGRKFRAGRDVPPERGYHLPEIRMPLMMGIFGSAFCATLSHYYREIRPLVQNLAGFAAVDEMIWGHNEDLSKVHPIDPATLPNPVYGMDGGRLAATAPPGICGSEYIQLMDAGMSNNLPLYPFLRPGRGVEVVIAFDASADVRTDNWLSVADGYARRRGVKGWPVGIGWPKPTAAPAASAAQLREAGAASAESAEEKLAEAKTDQAVRRADSAAGVANGKNNGKDTNKESKYSEGDEAAGELGYCTVWVGTKQEQSSSTNPSSPSFSSSSSSPSDPPPSPPPSKAIDESTAWQLTSPDAGLVVIYLPFLANPSKFPGVDPSGASGGGSEYMSTWNFVYTPRQVDQTVGLARANFAEGAGRIRAAVRAVYERKRRAREEGERRRRVDEYRRRVRMGVGDRLGEGDHFS